MAAEEAEVAKGTDKEGENLDVTAGPGKSESTAVRPEAVKARLRAQLESRRVAAHTKAGFSRASFLGKKVVEPSAGRDIRGGSGVGMGNAGGIQGDGRAGSMYTSIDEDDDDVVDLLDATQGIAQAAQHATGNDVIPSRGISDRPVGSVRLAGTGHHHSRGATARTGDGRGIQGGDRKRPGFLRGGRDGVEWLDTHMGPSLCRMLLGEDLDIADGTLSMLSRGNCIRALNLGVESS